MVKTPECVVPRLVVCVYRANGDVPHWVFDGVWDVISCICHVELYVELFFVKSGVGKLIVVDGVKNGEVGELEIVDGVSGGVTDVASGILIGVVVEDVAKVKNVAEIEICKTLDTKLVELVGLKVVV